MHQTPLPRRKLKKRWKFFFLVLGLAISALFGLGFFLIANDAPIITGSVTRNVEYKPGLKLDVYAPTRQVYDQTPVVVYIHGGAWIGGIKEGINFNRFNQAANDLRESGYAIVSINYTLAKADQSPFPACIEDAADALVWIQENAATHNFDLNNVGLFGESAGAQISMMVAYSDSLQSADYPLIHFKYVVNVYGPNRLKEIYESPAIDTLYSKLAGLPVWLQGRLDLAKYIFGFDPKQDSLRALQVMEMYSPYNYVNSSAPPTLIIHGDKDRVVPLDQSIGLHAKFDSLGVENEIHIIEGADHALVHATSEQKSTLQNWIAEFIRRHYSRKD
jgi:acetyl esterase/lipase